MNGIAVRCRRAVLRAAAVTGVAMDQVAEPPSLGCRREQNGEPRLLAVPGR